MEQIPSEAPTPVPMHDGVVDSLDSLPELEPATLPPATPPPTEGEAPPTHPRTPPAGRHIPLPNAVWQAGWINGRPVFPGAEVPAGEYGPERPGERIIHLHDPNELPPLLEAGQTLVIHLHHLPPDLYLPHVAATGGVWDAPYRDLASRDSVEGRLLELRWNDKRIWRQDHAPFHSLVWGLVSPDEVLPDTNLLSIHNAGTRAVGLDAVWLEPHRLGDVPYGVILQNAQWLNRSDSLWVRQAMVEVPIPQVLEQTFPLPPGRFTPPSSAAELLSRWEGAGQRFQRLVDMGHPHAELLREWIPPLRELVQREIIPSVRLQIGHVNRTQCLAAAYVFGDLIHSWAFSSGGGTTDALRQLRKRIESPLILAGSRTEGGLPTPMPLDAWSAFDYRYHAGRFRAMYFSGEINEANMLSGTTLQYLNLRFSPLLAFQHSDRNFHTLDFHKSLVEGLMYSRRSAVVRGGEAGGPFFPDGSDRGDHHWKLLKHVFRFGGPSHRKSHGNLQPANPSLDLGGALWAVADNGADSVHVLIHNPVNRNGREAVLEVPLPWTGPTRVLHHRVATVWSRSTDSEIVSENSLHEAQPFANGGRVTEETPFRSWFRTGIKLEGMHLLELSPADRPEAPRDIRAPAVVGYGSLRERADLFTVSRRPPPPWWTRTPAIRPHAGNWHSFGPATLRINADATLGDTPDWRALRGTQRAEAGTFPDTSPLGDKSTFLSFPEDVNESRAFVHATFDRDNVRSADSIGIWVRAHRPPGNAPPPPGRPAESKARFYLGSLPDRQRLELEYDTWYFLSSEAEHWRIRPHRTHPRLHVWHDEVDRLPPPPSPQLMEHIRTHFPLVEPRLRPGKLGAVLWLETQP